MLLVLLVFLLTFSALAQVGVTTWHNNLARTGENLNETILTPANVNPAWFGKVFSHPVDGKVFAQPLYLPSVSIPGKGVRNVVFVATEHDSVYAFDADSNTGAGAAPLWHVNLLNSTEGETTVSVDDVLGCLSITPELGITGTPVIDPSTNTLYVAAMAIRRGDFIHRLHALDVATGAERPGSPVVVEASVPGTGDSFTPGIVRFQPYLYKNRTGLLLLNGVVYTAWTSHCDTGAFHGWIIGYDAEDLRQVAVFNSTPNGFQGSFWMGGAAPSADDDGNIFAITGNGKFDAAGSDFGNTFLKLASTDGLTVADYFTPFNQFHLDRRDIDLGSSSALLLPEAVGSPAHRRLLVSAGKEGRIYLIDRDRMGRFQAGNDSQIVQSIEGALGPMYGGAAYFKNTLYFSAGNDSLKAFSITEGLMSSAPVSRSSQVLGFPGAVPSVTANGSSNGIVWLVESSHGGTLRAYDAANVANEIYNSQMAAARDAPGSFVKFSVPTIVNGKVYVGTENALAVYGLLRPQPAPVAIVNAASFEAGAVAPGSLISIFGANLAQSTMFAPAGSMPLSLGGATLRINGIAAPLLFVSPGQINAQVPFDATVGPALAVLQLTDTPPVTIRLSILPAAPGIFSMGGNQAAVWNADGSLNTPDHPAEVDSVVSLYLTGAGVVDESGSPIHSVTATVGGYEAIVSFAGLSPDVPGLFQIDLIVPSIGAGSHALIVSVNDTPSNAVSLSVSGN